jgi:hypothetical protein
VLNRAGQHPRLGGLRAGTPWAHGRHPPAPHTLLWGEEADAKGWINLQATYNFKKAAAEHAKLLPKKYNPAAQIWLWPKTRRLLSYR